MEIVQPDQIDTGEGDELDDDPLEDGTSYPPDFDPDDPENVLPDELEPDADYQPGVQESRYLDEKELEKIQKRLEGERARHDKRLAEIMGDDLGGHIPCPACMDGIAGYIVPPDVAPLTDDQRERMKQIMGLDNWETMPEADWARQCVTCLGHGNIRTGSIVPGRETVECMDCGGAGYINTRKAQTTPALQTPEGEIVTGPTVFPDNEPDPRVDALRRDGFTVIPPMHVGQ